MVPVRMVGTRLHPCIERLFNMLQTLRTAVADPAQVSDRAIDRHATAHDASHFLLIPQAVVTAVNASEVGALMRASAAQGVQLTLRSGRICLRCLWGHVGVLVCVVM